MDIKCGGRYNCYPNECDMCCRYMDDCDGSDEFNDMIEQDEEVSEREDSV